jgi:hypothetical protein
MATDLELLGRLTRNTVAEILAERKEEPKCESCRVNYARIACDECGASLCLLCTKAINETTVACKNGCNG